MKSIELDVAIFGGGVAGLWLLDTLVQRGFEVLLLEGDRLGGGQTVASQGIIHGGLKYTLEGMFTSSAQSIREMPAIWRESLAGRREPDLRQATIRAEHGHLWRTRNLRSRAGELGARIKLRVKPVKLTIEQRPEPLRSCPGDVSRLDEQIIDPVSLAGAFAERNEGRILRIEPKRGLAFTFTDTGAVSAIQLQQDNRNDTLELHPRDIVLTAGAGNAELRSNLNLADGAMQVRPLHMIMVRGALPVLNGHCTDASLTPRVTITSAYDATGCTVWQVGGRPAEDGVGMERRELLAHARRELLDVLPDVNLDGLSWSTYKVDRAEPVSPGGKRPSDPFARREGNVITAWPTKMALAPRLADQVLDLLAAPSDIGPLEPVLPADWPRPQVAQPPWETEQEWIVDP